MKSVVKIRGMRGMGDNIYQRPFIRAEGTKIDVYLETPFPEFYGDLPGVRCLKPGHVGLRTQQKNINRQSSRVWHMIPAGSWLNLTYSRDFVGNVRGLERVLPLGDSPFIFDLPEFKPLEIKVGRPIAVVRPVTLRNEWLNPARNPLPEYVAQLAEVLMDDYYVVSVADVEKDHEWILEPEPPAHKKFHRGELRPYQLVSLFRQSALVVGGVGWIVPMALATNTPIFVVGGGQGGHNSPGMITDPRIDLSKFGFAWPDNYCWCMSMRHQCNKKITTLMAQFNRWRNAQRL